MFSKSALLLLVLPAFTLAAAPISPNKHILERQSSSCEDIFAKTCPGSTNCCPQLWECKKDDPKLCTASVANNYILTVSAIDWKSAQGSISRDINSIRSRVSGALASITGGGTSARTTPISSAARSVATIGDGLQSSSESQAVVALTPTPTPTARASVSTASLAAATVSATGAAALPMLNKNMAIGGIVGLAPMQIMEKSDPTSCHSSESEIHSLATPSHRILKSPPVQLDGNRGYLDTPATAISGITPSATSSQTLLPASDIATAPAKDANSSTQYEKEDETLSTAASPVTISGRAVATDKRPTAHSDATKTRSEKYFKIFLYWHRPLIAVFVYVFSVGMASSAATRKGLMLATISPTMGTWELAILAKAGDIAFAFAIEDMFDSLAWGRLKQSQLRRGFVNLPWFLTTWSATGPIALLRIFWKEISGRIFADQQRFQGRRRERWKNCRLLRWSFARLVCLMLLIPGPGIILLGDIQQETVYHATETMSVSTGLGSYDPTLAASSFNHTQWRDWAPEISRLSLDLLRDRSIVWPTEPENIHCKRASTCQSYLLVGLSQTVWPWPDTGRQSILPDATSAAFKLGSAAYYQVDIWEPDPIQGLPRWNSNPNIESPPDVLLLSNVSFNAPTECADFTGLGSEAMNLCVTRDNDKDALAAAWDLCFSSSDRQSDSVPCLQRTPIFGLESWSIYVAVYRRNATIVFSLDTANVIAASDLSRPVVQNITGQSMGSSLRNILHQTLKPPMVDSAQLMSLTNFIISSLSYSAVWRLRVFSQGKAMLTNILVMPLLMFQPTFLPPSTRFPPFEDVLGQNNGNYGPWTEHKALGSFCRIEHRSIPGHATVIAYGFVAGFIILLVLLTKTYAYSSYVVDTSDFPALDYIRLTHLVGPRASDGDVSFLSLMDNKSHSTGNILESIEDIRVGLRDDIV
ncbi:hypothetical protein FB567DRAFT_632440 [Paraphoma chrysanthemicola]|uniref:Uncharacterized protein n=1 Tax=Paraphoma chrysanthemicola TaxID=798071 RepID=A0A8K0VTS7_9PLEO|nr:hypothetical protein FB567DRAFT_632440 [Paraphoma chrysanthemicola]